MLFEQVMPLKYFPIPNMHNENKMDVYQKHSVPRFFSFLKISVFPQIWWLKM